MIIFIFDKLYLIIFTAMVNTYKRISHSERIDLIYERIVHRASVRRMSKERGLAENTIRNILKAFSDSGRTNRKYYKRSAGRPRDNSLFYSPSSHNRDADASISLLRGAASQSKVCTLYLLSNSEKLGVCSSDAVKTTAIKA